MPTRTYAQTPQLPARPGYPKQVPLKGNAIQPKVWVDDAGEAWVALMSDESGAWEVLLYADHADIVTVVASAAEEPLHPDIWGNLYWDGPAVSYSAMAPSGSWVMLYEDDPQTTTPLATDFYGDGLEYHIRPGISEAGVAWQGTTPYNNPNWPAYNWHVWGVRVPQAGCLDYACAEPSPLAAVDPFDFEEQWPTVGSSAWASEARHYQSPYIENLIRVWDLDTGWERGHVRSHPFESVRYPHMRGEHLVFERVGAVTSDVYHQEVGYDFGEVEPQQPIEPPAPCVDRHRPRLSEEDGRWVVYRGEQCGMPDPVLYVTDTHEGCIWEVREIPGAHPADEPTYYAIHRDTIVYSVYENNEYRLYIHRFDVEEALEACFSA